MAEPKKIDINSEIISRGELSKKAALNESLKKAQSKEETIAYPSKKSFLEQVVDKFEQKKLLEKTETSKSEPAAPKAETPKVIAAPVVIETKEKTDAGEKSAFPQALAKALPSDVEIKVRETVISDVKIKADTAKNDEGTVSLLNTEAGRRAAEHIMEAKNAAVQQAVQQARGTPAKQAGY